MTSDRAWVTSFVAAENEDVAVPPELLAAVEAEVSPADLAIMVHTSGSTADPKGVLHTHGTLVRQTSTWPSALRAITRSEGSATILCAMPFFWIGGVLAAMGALHEPVTLLVMPRLDAGTALDLAERERATGIVGWPAFTQRLREHPSFAGRDLSSAPMLRQGPLDIAMTDVPDGFPVHRTMSETAGGFAFTDISIVDEDGRPVPDGTTGELLIRGIGAMAGYNKRERWETFDDDGWYHTGDRVYRRADDPRLFYVGRTSELIKSAGANVSPIEVEAVIEQLPDVAQCVVVGIDHPERGEEVCAVVVPATAQLDLNGVAAHTREQLSAYKVPTRWIVATSEQIPTLPSGKAGSENVACVGRRRCTGLSVLGVCGARRSRLRDPVEKAQVRCPIDNAQVRPDVPHRAWPHDDQRIRTDDADRPSRCEAGQFRRVQREAGFGLAVSDADAGRADGRQPAQTRQRRGEQRPE